MGTAEVAGASGFSAATTRTRRHSYLFWFPGHIRTLQRQPALNHLYLSEDLMTNAPKIVPTETKEPGVPAEGNKPAVVSPAAPTENKPAAEPAASKK
jgi:hypothetical protein